MKRAIIITLISISAQTAFADYHYASHEGSNTYPYTSWATAAYLIQDAVDAASPRDTVYIDSGEWFETVMASFYDSVAVIGMGIDSTFWRTDEYRTQMLWLCDGGLVEGITFQHLDNWRCLMIPLPASAVVKNCKFIHSRIGIAAAGGIIEIFNNQFDSCGTAILLPIWAGDFHIHNNFILNSYDDWAIELQVYSALVENNIIISPPGYVSVDGIHSGLLAGEVVIRNNVVINGESGIVADAKYVYNNTIKNTGPGGVGWGMAVSYMDSIYNNSLTENRRAIMAPDSCYFNYNNTWGNRIEPSFDLFINPVGNISADPMYVSYSDVHLQAYSPLIDAGDPNILDVDGTRSDIGCYGGPHGCSYTYLDLAPRIPDSISAFVDSGMITLVWRYNTEADFNRYQIYRDTIPGFEPSIFDIIAEPDTSYYEDTDILPGTPYYYRLTSVDNQGNISNFSEEIAVVPTSAWDIIDAKLPYEPRITSAYPNPFNSNIVIVYSASNLGPQPPQVTLKVYDIQGRVVKTLVDDRIPMGTYRAIWDGTNDAGDKVASGTYIARVAQWGCPGGDFPVKITLIR